MQHVNAASSFARLDGKAAIVTLHNRSVDAARGFATMVEHAEPAFQTTAENFRAIPAGNALQLARLLAEAGVEVDDTGTLMATVNQAVVTLRSIFDAIDDDVLVQIRSGEAHVPDAFDAALDAPLDVGVHTELLRMRDELSDLLAQSAHVD